jgi:uncharacterized protein YndB with AHSA1/START domain
MTHTTTVTLPSDREITVTRTVKAPRDLVWKAYTDPVLLRQWLLGPPGWTMPVCELDVRVGGAYRYVWRSEDGTAEFGMHGLYKEVVEPGRMVISQLFDGPEMGGETTASTSLIAEGDLTTIVTTILYDTKEGRDAAAATGMADGMEAGYQRLESLAPAFARS